MDPRQNSPQNQPSTQPGFPPQQNQPAASPFQQAMRPAGQPMSKPGGPVMPPAQYAGGPPLQQPSATPPPRPQSVGNVPQPPQPQPGTLNPKQQVVEALRGATNVLVTVSDNPSVDQLSSAIGLTLMMNKLNKHATAVFSGKVPSTIEFLQPHKILESNTDSLRDFIISLDREKADHLRYKIEDNVVKIFITPYRTSISEADLTYSQGDFNIDVVIALGVAESVHLDQAISAHGRILHDATIIGISSGNIITSVGSVNWCDPQASSLSEMLVSISESFKSGILDTQMATAFLTGIVAETERFSNDKTSPKVMTMSAQLMAAGANQQLISTQLELPPPPPPEPPATMQPLEAPMPAFVPEPVLPPVEPKKDASEFEVPKPGEDGPVSSDLISLHSDTEDSKPQEEMVEQSFNRELKSPAPAFEQQPSSQDDVAASQIHIDENGTIITPPAPESTNTEPNSEENKPTEEKKAEESKEQERKVDESVNKDQNVGPAPTGGRELLSNEEPDSDSKEAPAEEEDDKRNKKRRLMPIMHGHEKVIKPLSKDKNEKPKTDLKHFDFNASDGATPSVVADEKPKVASQDSQKVTDEVNNTDAGVMLPPLPPVSEPPSKSPTNEPTSGQLPQREVEDEDSARKAVMDAMSSADYKPVAESPLEALSAPAVPLNEPLPAQPDATSPAGPPPPPLPPPFPMTPPTSTDPNTFQFPSQNQETQKNPFNLPQ